MTTGFKDHFSVANGYGRYRPGYPDELFEFLAGAAPGCGCVWDCGTGSGQAARGSARLFERVVATDPSLRQLARADGGGAGVGLTFVAGRAESAPLADGSVDLVTVGQAIHWFEFDAFYSEVERVSRPGGVLAAWTYGFFRVALEIDGIIDHLARRTVGSFWPRERRYVDEGYDDLPFPFARLATPSLEMRASWDLDAVMGYLGTWSAVNRYRRQKAHDPLTAVRRDLLEPWGPGQRTVTWPMTILAGRVPG